MRCEADPPARPPARPGPEDAGGSRALRPDSRCQWASHTSKWVLPCCSVKPGNRRPPGSRARCASAPGLSGSDPPQPDLSAVEAVCPETVAETSPPHVHSFRTTASFKGILLPVRSETILRKGNATRMRRPGHPGISNSDKKPRVLPSAVRVTSIFFQLSIPTISPGFSPGSPAGGAAIGPASRRPKNRDIFPRVAHKSARASRTTLALPPGDPAAD